MDGNRVTVMVAGQTFTLRGNEEEDYIKSVAAYADEQIDRIERANPSLATSSCVVLAAVNMADELFKLRRQYAELDARIEELRKLKVEPPQKPTRSRAARGSQTSVATAAVNHTFEEVRA